MTKYKPSINEREGNSTCGIFCGIGKLNSNRMISLGSMNEERGTDSVGIAYLLNNEIKIAKIDKRPVIGLNITLRKEVTEAAISGLFIGHTRQATQGTVNARNAHPFLIEGIAFAHNGIILNDDDFGQYEVDSESLIHGIKAKDFSKYEGAIALVWIEESKLKAYRCGNPLFRGRYNGSTYLASEGDYLKEIGCTHVKELSEGLIYTFDKSQGITTQKVLKNKTFGSFYGYKSQVAGGQGWEDYLDKQDNYKSNHQSMLCAPSEAKTVQSFAERKAEIDALDLEEDFRTPADILKTTHTQVMYDACDCCGTYNELSEKGMCLDCLTWLDGQGIDRDNPPAWMRVR